MKKYKVEIWYGKPTALITCVEIVRESKNDVFFLNSKARKHTNFTHYFDTRKEAFNFILDAAKVCADHAKTKLQAFEELLEDIKALEEK